MVFVNEKTPNNWRTIDNEQRASLVAKGSYKGEIELFDLEWEDQIISFQAKKAIDAAEGRETVVLWDIKKITVPEKLAGKESEIHRLIRESLDTYGLFHDRKNISEVRVEFSPRFN